MKSLFASMTLAICCLMSPGAFAELKAGTAAQTLSAIHPDFNRGVWYLTNYQLPTVIPVCSDIQIEKINKKKFVFTWKGQKYSTKLDKHTKRAGYSMQDALGHYFGDKCDSKKMKSLSKKDKEGIKQGRALVGMSKDGVLFAMGRPPFHVNPDLDVQTWMYWRNKFARTAIEFDEKGKVVNIR